MMLIMLYIVFVYNVVVVYSWHNSFCHTSPEVVLRNKNIIEY